HHYGHHTATLGNTPSIAALDFTRQGYADGAELHGGGSAPRALVRRKASSGNPGDGNGAPADFGIHVKECGQAGDGAKSRARRARGRMAVPHACLDVHSRAAVHGDEFYVGAELIVECLYQHLTPTGMLDQIRRQLRCDYSYATHLGDIKVVCLGHALRNAPALADLAWFFDPYVRLRAAFEHANGHFQRVMTTRVPSPTVDSMWNSLTRRRAPVRPNPKPVPEVQLSVMASSR